MEGLHSVPVEYQFHVSLRHTLSSWIIDFLTCPKWFRKRTGNRKNDLKADQVPKIVANQTVYFCKLRREKVLLIFVELHFDLILQLPCFCSCRIHLRFKAYGFCFSLGKVGQQVAP